MIIFTRFNIFWKYRGITIWPFVILKNRYKENKILLNHERIHLRQQIELLIIPFYLWYGLEFLIRCIQYKSWDKAYRNISFEREAYVNDRNLNYLPKRRIWSFLHHL